MANKYLDYNGLALFKQKLDGLFATQAVVNTKITDPTTKTQGQILSYNGTTWVASDAPQSGVISFNGRTGVVAPTAGDYNASQITYDGTSNVETALGDIEGRIDGIDSVTGIVKHTSTGYSAAVAGTDYQIPLAAGVDYQVPVSFADGYDAATNKAATVKTVTDAIGGITTFSFHICTAGEYDPTTRIPTITAPSTSTIYLVPKATVGTNQSYIEWAYISNNWEIIGDTQIQIETISNSEIDALFV